MPDLPTRLAVRRGDFGRLGHDDVLDVFIPKSIGGLAGQQVRAAVGRAPVSSQAGSARVLSTCLQSLGSR